MPAGRFYLFIFLFIVVAVGAYYIILKLGRVTFGGKAIYAKAKIDHTQMKNDIEGLEKAEELFIDETKNKRKN
jgi:hypothetical protein